MDVIIDDTVVEKYGLAIRMVKGTTEKFPYSVQYAPLYNDDTYNKEEFTLFGESVGYSTSEFETEEKAKEFFNDILNLNKEQLSNKYPNIWVE